MPFFTSRHRRLPSADKENMAGDDFIAIEADVTLSASTVVGLSITEDNRILKLDASSPLANKFKVGDKFICINGMPSP